MLETKEQKRKKDDFEDMQSEVFACREEGYDVSFIVCDVPHRTLEASADREAHLRFSCADDECSSGFRLDRHEHIVGSVCVDEDDTPNGTAHRVWGTYFCRQL